MYYLYADTFRAIFKMDCFYCHFIPSPLLPNFNKLIIFDLTIYSL